MRTLVMVIPMNDNDSTTMTRMIVYDGFISIYNFDNSTHSY